MDENKTSNLKLKFITSQLTGSNKQRQRYQERGGVGGGVHLELEFFLKKNPEQRIMPRKGTGKYGASNTISSKKNPENPGC